MDNKEKAATEKATGKATEKAAKSHGFGDFDLGEGSTAKTTTTMIKNRINTRSIKPFDGRNYSIWALRMKDFLRELGLLQCIEGGGEITEEEDIQALTEIRHALADSQMKHIMKCDTAFDAWEKIWA